MAEGAEGEERKEKRPLRVWCDGCWDLMHFGHANALRQAKAAGDILVVGVHSDADITKHKGPPVLHDVERLEVVSACKWVDEVVFDAPYETQLATLDKHHIDFCVHGEDVSTRADGTDSFFEVKEAGRFKFIKRTDGVSTTDLVGRMLLMTKGHFKRFSQEDAELLERVASPTAAKMHFQTSMNIVQFSSGRVAKPTDRIVFIPGGWDLLHVGHIRAMKAAREMGNFLLVGIWHDEDINKRKGANYPIMNLHERTMLVMSCKYVDEVVIGAPYAITEDLIDSFGISVVVHGNDSVDLLEGEEDPFKVPKERGIYKTFECTIPDLTTSSIVERVIDNRLRYMERNLKKIQKDDAANSPQG